MSGHPQHIPLQGSLNFRDFGGYPTEQGRRIISQYFFRSDKLSELTDDDQQTLAKHNIGHIFDLRRPDEVARAPSRWQSSEANTHHYSIIHPALDGKGMLAQFQALREHEAPGISLMEALYRDMGRGDHSYPYFKQLFQQLLDDTVSPVLVHCSGGKDRTGTTCALIQWVLGCDMATIMADYMLSKPLYCDKVDPLHMSMQLAHLDEGHNIKSEWLIPIMQVHESYLQAMFDGLFENHSDPHSFIVKGLGLSDDSIDRLRQHYTETI